MSDVEDGQTNDPLLEQEQQAREPASVDSGATRGRTLMDVMKDPWFNTTVHALEQVLLPAVLVELQPVWQAALSRAEEERMGDGPVLTFGVIEASPELRAEFDRRVELCREALLFAFDAALPAAMDVMDAMLAARYQGLHIERFDRQRRGTATDDDGAGT